jgi:Mn2+/Fe2+ NRAMP family transporter
VTCDRAGWGVRRGTVTFPEVHATIPIPATGFIRKFIAFAGPGYLVAVHPSGFAVFAWPAAVLIAMLNGWLLIRTFGW